MGHKTDGYHFQHCLGAVRCSLQCQCSMINARYSRNVLSQYEVSFQTIEDHVNCPQFLCSSFSHKIQNFGPQNQVVNISSELFSAHKKLFLSVSLQAPVSVTAGGKNSNLHAMHVVCQLAAFIIPVQTTVTYWKALKPKIE